MKFLLIIVLLLRNVRSNFESENCDRPLGMESGLIKDEDLTASSTHDSTSVGPQMSRFFFSFVFRFSMNFLFFKEFEMKSKVVPGVHRNLLDPNRRNFFKLIYEIYF